MPVGVEIRKATAGDESFIRACAQAAFSHYVPRIGRAPAPLSADYAAHIVAGNVYVACNSRGEIDGYIVFFPQGRAMVLDIVAVFPQVAGLGIGKSLIVHCEATARAAGLACVQLYTNTMMIENLALYSTLGYIETARKVDDGFARVYFEKPLN